MMMEREVFGWSYGTWNSSDWQFSTPEDAYVAGMDWLNFYNPDKDGGDIKVYRLLVEEVDLGPVTG